MDLLARGIGRALSGKQLRGAYLPVGIGVDSAREIAWATVQVSGEAAAVVVADGDARTTPDDDVPEVDASMATRYRTSDRLAIFVQGAVELASLRGTFRPVLTESFPEEFVAPLDWQRLAGHSLDVVIEHAGAASGWPLTKAVRRLAQVLELTAAIHADAGSGNEPWNALWWAHARTSLARLSDAIERAPDDAELAEVVEANLFAAFSLPRPKAGRDVGKSDARRWRTAIDDWWSSTDSIASVLGLLEGRGGASRAASQALGRIDWSELDRWGIELGSSVAALSRTDAKNPSRVRAFAALAEDDFLNPSGDLSGQPLLLRSPSGAPLDAGGPIGDVSVVASSFDAELRAIVSEEFVVRAQLLAVPDGPVSLDGLQVETAPKRATFHVTAAEVVDGDLSIRGHIEYPVSKGGFGYSARRRSVSISLDVDHELQGRMAPNATAQYILLPPSGSGAIVAPLRSNGSAGKPEVLAPTRFMEDGSVDPSEPSTSVHSTSAGLELGVLAFGADTNDASLNGSGLTPVEGRHGLATGRLAPSGNDELVVGDTHTEIRLDAGDEPPLSPLVGAWTGAAHAAGEVPDEVSGDLRGRIEQFWADRLLQDDQGTLRALGHVALASDQRDGVGALAPAGASGAMFAPPRLAGEWAGLGSLDVPSDFVESPEADAFRAALDALDVPRRLGIKRADELMTTLPSMTSWRSLWSGARTELQDYLDAYAELVAAARAHGNHNALLWASYPFSVTLWSTASPPAQCRAVMLGPLHPLRLAWLAGVEHTLAEVAVKVPLVGLVEGWNLPALGPHNSSGRMVALPIDNGPEQVFVGWSMLVALTESAPVALDVPHAASGLPVPGSASTGLNAGGVTSALRDYRKMNPHVSTLVVDMTSSSVGPRLEDVDKALLREVAEWSSHTSGLPGGVRVHDSLSRQGRPPREEVVGLVRNGIDVPVTWSRYSPDESTHRPANLRILQDAGVGIAAGDEQSRGRGVLGEVPLRRFTVPDPELDANGCGVTRPGLSAGGWRPIVEALRLLESWEEDRTPIIRTSVAGELLVRDDAEWVVSGEALLTPAAIAKLLNKHGTTSRMLWEWRPPFLQGKDATTSGLMERRPYVSVVNLPRWFVSDLATRLQTIREVADGEPLARQMLLELGQRGLGLSSLVAMGETHAIGAIGFYVTMLLLDPPTGPNLLPQDERNLFVLPIDVCDPFLMALADVQHQGKARQRADLLAIELSDEGVILTPIEIKVRAVGTPVATLPEPDSSDMAEPLQQLASTSSLIDRIVERMGQLDRPADRTLAHQGLGALVVAAMGLTPALPGEASLLVDQLGRLVAGELPVSAGQPLLVHLNNTVPGYSGPLVKTDRVAAPFEHGVVVCSLKSALAEAEAGTGGDFTDAVRGLLPQTDSPAESVPNAQTPSEPEPEPRDAAIHGRPASTLIAGGYDASLDDGDEIPSQNAGEETGADQTLTLAADRPATEYVRGVRGQGIKFDVGDLLDSKGSSLASYWPSNTALNQLNIGVIGDLGTGKTQLLKALIRNVRTHAATQQSTPVSILVFDYKRDFQDEKFLDDVGGRLLPPNRIPIDIFGLQGEATQEAVYRRARSFMDVISRVYSGIGPVQSDRFVTVVIDLFGSLGRAPTLAEVSAQYREAAGSADSMTSVMNTFVLGGILESDHEKLVPFNELLDDTVLVVDLHSLGVDQSAKNALVALFLNLYFEHMQDLEKWPYEEEDGVQLRRLNSFLLVDEATNIMNYRFQVLSDLLLQGREFGVGIILSSQYLDHFTVGGVNYGKPLLTWFIHKVPQVTTKELAKLGLPDATQQQAERISSLEVHQAFYRSLGFNGRFIRGIPYYQLVDRE